MSTQRNEAEVTAGDQRPEVWKAIPGFSAYEASDNSVWRLDDGKPIQVSGGIRSVDRISGNRRLKGVLLKARLSNQGYVQVNIYDDNGKMQTRPAHSLILLTFEGPRPDDMETLHDPRTGPLDNRWPEKIRYDSREANLADWRASNPPKPKPVKHCVRCDAVMTGNGKRCHPCVVEIGDTAAGLLRGGATLGDAAEQLGYPSLDGLHTLAVKHGGYGVERPRWTQRVTVTLRRLVGGRD